MAEVWKSVVGYEGFYEVSNIGRVRRIAPGNKTYVGKILKPEDVRGYHRVELFSSGPSRRFFIQGLVAAAFIGPRPDGFQVNHIDGDKANNRPENLEYVTGAENMRHASEHDLVARGGRNGAYTHPETRARGDRNGSRLHPESRPRGDAHHARSRPEIIPRGETHGMAKLTETDVREIRSQIAQGRTLSELARAHGVTVATIFNIKIGKIWKHLL